MVHVLCWPRSAGATGHHVAPVPAATLIASTPCPTFTADWRPAPMLLSAARTFEIQTLAMRAAYQNVGGGTGGRQHTQP